MGEANLASVIASVTLGYVVGFGYLTGWDAYKLITKAKNPARNLFTWMTCGVIVACVTMSVVVWLTIHGYIRVSVLSLFLTLLIWVVIINFILQIIINRIAIISPSQKIVNRVRFGVAIYIALINATVIGTFIPAVMGASPGITSGGEVYAKVAKVLILVMDCFLNFYFISEVKDNLIRNGLKKYERLANFNMSIIVVSVMMDLFLFAMTFLPGTMLFVPFIPVTYITKLKIELSMTKLIIKIAKEDSNTFSPPASLQTQDTSDTIVADSPMSTRIHFGSRAGETVRITEGVPSYGLGLTQQNPAFVGSQDVPLCYESTQKERVKRCSRLSEEELYDSATA
ncbi:hypothetical protein BLS_005756 [Venturia inaequalis]|uniref:Uncharacterized protein n=1 Tax=Venturia inaequalis TaxID=5025 RepID=A0A8H3YTH1_VENIN|nr:hypothetical protein EG328_008064 [Venturia inaequalis]KAE9968666.1 hypothetical protein BLS_005756 [Venturia inaequalis]KAE9977640.1 hypothetical protein EG327_007672 [Venturia inaequalis]